MTIHTEEHLAECVAAYLANGSNKQAAADAMGMTRHAMRWRLKVAAERGMLGTEPVLPGYRISQISTGPNGTFVQQRPERGEEYAPTKGLALKGRTTWTDADGRITQQVHMERADAKSQLAAMQAAVEALNEDLPRETPVAPPKVRRSDLLNFYAITDVHMGALSWHEETGADYDLEIAERGLMDWFAAAIDLAPNSGRAVLAQIGDLLHHDGMESKTPASGHILDADSRLQKIIRVAIRCLRRIVRMLLLKHEHVHVVMADANHDPAGGAWLREMFAAFYEDEPRVTVDSSASTYYVVEHGDVSLFVHHGHKRNISNVDSVFAGKFRDIYGRTRFSYAHLGHLHSDEMKSTNLMKVERHETLAAPDAYAANGGWLSGRSAKVITYHKKHGEVSRLVMSPEMVTGWGDPEAANDNEPQMRRAG